MPELPEVEQASRALAHATVGRTILRVLALHPALRRTLPPRRAALAAGRRVERVERRAKHQLVYLAGGGALHVHFRMAGDWAFGLSDDPIPRHARALIELDDGTRVALVDPRALSTLSVVRADEHRLPPLGPEPLDERLDATMLRASLARRRGAIKPALLDQRVVAGIGNIYAAESLWHARIDPRTAAAALGHRRLDRLIEAMRHVVRAALREPGRYSDPEAQADFQVYGREGEFCTRCGRKIRRIVQAGRSTCFCPGCQR